MPKNQLRSLKKDSVLHSEVLVPTFAIQPLVCDEP